MSVATLLLLVGTAVALTAKVMRVLAKFEAIEVVVARLVESETARLETIEARLAEIEKSTERDA